ncbi:hypothetical protein GQ457_14G015170 [Hibiscus cannabinus]
MAGPSDEPEEQTPSLQVEAIIRELKKSFHEELEPIHDRLDRLEGSQTNTPEEDHAENGSDQTPNQRQNLRQGRVQQVDDNLNNIKIAIPSFQGRTDLDADSLTTVLDPLQSKKLRFDKLLRSSNEPEGQTPSLHTEAIIQELKKSFREELEPIHDRLERLEGSQTNAPEEDHAENGSDQTPNQRQNPRQGRGRTDPDAYLAWESKVEHVFECYNYSEQKKVRLAAMEFIDYALLWWDQLLISRRRTGEGPVRDWAEMKRIMRRRFVPSHYHRDLFQKLQGLRQGSRSVEDYFKEMEMSMMRANIVEDREATMARFLSGLNTDIANVVELQHYVELDEMVHMAIKVERQQRRKTTSSRGNISFKSVSSTPFNSSNNFRKPASQAPLQIRERTETSKPKPPVVDVGRGKQSKHPTPQERSRDIQCFKCLGRGHVANQCPNRRTKLLRDNGDIESKSEEDEPIHLVEDTEDDDLEEPESDKIMELMVIKRSLNAQPVQNEQQRENIFHTRCNVLDKVCVVIIDSGSCTNVASSVMVDKLGLKTTKHPQPYKLQWLNDGGELKVTRQVVVPFSIGKYKDEILCDVVTMDATHLLLGRPWQRIKEHDVRELKLARLKLGSSYAAHFSSRRVSHFS